MDIRDQLKSIREALRMIDADLRKHAGACPGCGKPRGGFVPAGKTPRQVGICDCQLEEAGR